MELEANCSNIQYDSAIKDIKGIGASYISQLLPSSVAIGEAINIPKIGI